MRPDRLLKFAEAILERAPLTVMLQRRRAVEFFLPPADHEEEVIWQQVQLTRLRIGLIDDDQQQPLRMLPRLGLVPAQFDDLFITFLGRTPHGPPEMRRRQSFEHRVALDAPDKS